MILYLYRHVFITTCTCLQKLSNRLKALQTPPSGWSEKRKDSIKKILASGLDYVSSEESGDDGVTLYRRKLPWMKPKYTRCLKTLDKIHFNTLSAKSKGMIRPREEGSPSERPIPESLLEFAIDSTLLSHDENVDPHDISLMSTDSDLI